MASALALWRSSTVRETGLRCYVLTNMEVETYPLRLKRFSFPGWFDGTVVSGREGVAKPDSAIFTRLLDRFGLAPNTTFFECSQRLCRTDQDVTRESLVRRRGSSSATLRGSSSPPARR